MTTIAEIERRLLWLSSRYTGRNATGGTPAPGRAPEPERPALAAEYRELHARWLGLKGGAR